MKTFLAARYYEHMTPEHIVGCWFLITGTRKINSNHDLFSFLSNKKEHITVVMAQLVNSDSTVLLTPSLVSVRITRFQPEDFLAHLQEHVLSGRALINAVQSDASM